MKSMTASACSYTQRSGAAPSKSAVRRCVRSTSQHLSQMCNTSSVTPNLEAPRASCSVIRCWPSAGRRTRSHATHSFLPVNRLAPIRPSHSISTSCSRSRPRLPRPSAGGHAPSSERRCAGSSSSAQRARDASLSRRCASACARSPVSGSLPRMVALLEVCCGAPQRGLLLVAAQHACTA